MSNKLKYESSPYLLQHSENPVNWYAWNEESLELARREDKPIIVSVGYASCHWCHVMEKESFEDVEVAEVMNKYFICIKVDREERPDIDHLYMTAVQIMTGSGGWPMNVICLPDGKPFWGGTYFKKEQWISVLQQLGELYEEDKPRIEDYADKLASGILSVNLTIPESDGTVFSKDELNSIITKWSQKLDNSFGGRSGAPKFMMPVNLEYLLKYYMLTGNTIAGDHVQLTLKKMALGGLYDHIGGGFSRYSVDDRWHVPHFEKMLYDNAQLIDLYTKAWVTFNDPHYKKVVEECIAFLQNELQHSNGMFFSSLDADSPDSKGKVTEGAYYVWKEKELKDLPENDQQLFHRYFNINDKGYWESGNYVLFRDLDDHAFTSENKLTPEELHRKLLSWKTYLLKLRSERKPPSLDDKILTSWNALAIKALANASVTFDRQDWLDIAIRNAEFVNTVLTKPEGTLFRVWKDGKAYVDAFLEDYALIIEAFITLYEVTGNDHWIMEAKRLCNLVLDDFYYERTGFFLFSPIKDEQLIAPTIEKSDNVIPASNSVMAINLFKLARYFSNQAYDDIALRMYKAMRSEIMEYPDSHANWLNLGMNFLFPFREIVITGESSAGIFTLLRKTPLTNILWAHTKDPVNIPLLKGRYSKDETLIYICRDQHCELPVKTLGEALKLLDTP
ncbi:thioredoxin domain-containing protein [Robertkochia solimangrovi]|uniref:thioredoxin domain-containing protein n=1 Tax=Robertkochia solimangrovi TaxID=2213046 RepID=UPI0013A558C1|nr:thioredoxin domain-containing protein [Robertkochia solimangrovi]